MFSSVTTYKYKHHVKLMPRVSDHHSCSLQVIDILQPRYWEDLISRTEATSKVTEFDGGIILGSMAPRNSWKKKTSSGGNKLASYVVGTHVVAHHRSKLQRTLIFGQLGLFPVTGWTSKSSKDKGVNPFGSPRFLDHALACEKFKLLLYHSLHPNTNKRDHELYPQESGASSKFSGLTSQCISPAVRSSRKAHKSCHPKSRTVGNRGKPLPALLQLRNNSWFQQHTTHDDFLWSNY